MNNSRVDSLLINHHVSGHETIASEKSVMLGIKWRNIPKNYQSRLLALEGMTPYELLEVRPGVTPSELRIAYLKKLKTHHPDKNAPFMRDFSNQYAKLINAAYERIKKEMNQ